MSALQPFLGDKDAHARATLSGAADNLSDEVVIISFFGAISCWCKGVGVTSEVVEIRTQL
jgi:hypothetical protein